MNTRMHARRWHICGGCEIERSRWSWRESVHTPGEGGEPSWKRWLEKCRHVQQGGLLERGEPRPRLEFSMDFERPGYDDLGAGRVT